MRPFRYGTQVRRCPGEEALPPTAQSRKGRTTYARVTIRFSLVAGSARRAERSGPLCGGAAAVVPVAAAAQAEDPDARARAQRCRRTRRLRGGRAQVALQ